MPIKNKKHVRRVTATRKTLSCSVLEVRSVYACEKVKCFSKAEKDNKLQLLREVIIPALKEKAASSEFECAPIDLSFKIQELSAPTSRLH